MEPKKNPKADVGKRKGLYLEIGLVIALALVIGAFSISQSEKNIEIVDMGLMPDEIEMVEITMEEQPKQETVQQTNKVIADMLNVVKNDTKITTTFDFLEYDEDEIVLSTVNVEVEEIEEDAPVYFAEQMPTFQGGEINDKYRKWVYARLVYPEVAKDNGIQGTVTLQFTVERDGSLTNIRAVRSPDKLLSDEAIRVISQSPKWEPARQRNVPVRLLYTFQIQFILE